MGFLDYFTTRNAEMDYMLDLELIQEQSSRVHLKRMAIQTCINMIARTVSQSKIRMKDNNEVLMDEFYHKLNVRPNPNMTASTFWQKVIYKLIYDNECLIIQSDTKDLLIADDYDRVEYALVEDIFKQVTIKDYTYTRSFKMSEVIFLEFGNDKMSSLIDGLFADYGDLFGRIIEFQKRKNQIRGTVDVANVSPKDKDTQGKLQQFIDRMYKVIGNNSVAIVPQQRGFEYKELSANGMQGQDVDEVNKVTNGFFDLVAKSLGIPIGLLHGELADVEKQTKNYMTFCVDPLLKKIEDELNYKFINKKEFLNGKRVDIQRVSYSSLFDLATSIDKLVTSGAFKGNEIRIAAGYEPSDDPALDRHIITKNYASLEEVLKGGDNSEA